MRSVHANAEGNIQEIALVDIKKVKSIRPTLSIKTIETFN